ncbi:oxidoreductase [Gemmobacter tilapiae]|uniref:Oxidoreductase n=1 Tax=Neogemmobacter tilapiae TaxID=875041 RepID=A0A918WGZ6_9RHOB|nr:oxidoreductase [Gemmobacter tilapiae]
MVLTVTGLIGATNGEGAATFDLAMLEALDRKTFATTTIWTEGQQVLSGVPLVELLAHLKIKGRTLKVTAVNDYSIEVPISDAVQGGPILAYLNNGQRMTLRDKGPLWLVYPYDQNPAYQSETIYARSVWQLDRIEVLP